MGRDGGSATCRSGSWKRPRTKWEMDKARVLVGQVLLLLGEGLRAWAGSGGGVGHKGGASGMVLYVHGFADKDISPVKSGFRF